ncbi:hypothetical protein CCHR01_19611 [Colletotrichum chrysophilum]|uniref:Uncharacterized protein n=1 Tax=Colletotrichum chrysophilum TaxID=1836956 RepID=A0AAD9E7N7_9PEZI|nr:hypothetical protein CCHR01_19611 [Colletotrichum chrysophilum]
MWPVLPVCSFPTNNTLQCPVSSASANAVRGSHRRRRRRRPRPRSSLFKLHRPPRPLVHSATL